VDAPVMTPEDEKWLESLTPPEEWLAKFPMAAFIEHVSKCLCVCGCRAPAPTASPFCGARGCDSCGMQGNTLQL